VDSDAYDNSSDTLQYQPAVSDDTDSNRFYAVSGIGKKLSERCAGGAETSA
jgi:hypothetical protein